MTPGPLTDEELAEMNAWMDAVANAPMWGPASIEVSLRNHRRLITELRVSREDAKEGWALASEISGARDRLAAEVEQLRDIVDAVEDDLGQDYIDAPPVEPVGLAEIAQRLGVERQTAKQWNLRKLLPPPRWTVSGSPAWEWSDIEKWARKTGRLE
jgi:predicted DNA-binding transcriptional regulator AlpA